jgi:hypothetical protein
MLTRIFAALIATLVWAVPSLAFSQDEKSPNECGKYLTEMSEALDTLEALVPNVPPEEAGYLEKEYTAAVQILSGKRIFDAEHRRLYPAWHLHVRLNAARRQLKVQPGFQRESKSSLKTTIGMAAFLPYEMANVRIAWDEFSDADNGQILTLGQVRLGAEKSEGLIVWPGLYIACLANFIQDAK